MKNGYTCGLCPGKIEWIQQYSFLVLLLLLSQPCTCSLVLLGQTLRKVIATGTELAPSFLLFLSPDWSLWFSWETQRHTCTKLSTCQQGLALTKPHFSQWRQSSEGEQPARAWDLQTPDRNGRSSLENTFSFPFLSVFSPEATFH